MGRHHLDNEPAMKAIVAYLAGQQFALSISEIRWEMEMADGMPASTADAALAELEDQGRITVHGPYVKLAASRPASREPASARGRSCR